MLLSIGPVTKQHFYLAGALVAAGAVLAVVGFLAKLPLINLGGVFVLLTGLAQLLIFGLMFKKYGWKDEQRYGGGQPAIFGIPVAAAAELRNSGGKQ